MRTLHIGIPVTDLERSLAFYTGLGYDVLGKVPETEFGPDHAQAPVDEFVTIELVHDPVEGTAYGDVGRSPPGATGEGFATPEADRLAGRPDPGR